MTLEATCTKPLKNVNAHFDMKERPPVADEVQNLPPGASGTTFRLELSAIRNTTTITFRFEDTDGVKGERKIILNPRQDKSPSVRDFCRAIVAAATWTQASPGNSQSQPQSGSAGHR